MSRIPLIVPQPSRIDLTFGEWRREHRGRHSAGLHLRLTGPSVEGVRVRLQVLAGYLAEENHFDAVFGEGEPGDIHVVLSLKPRLINKALTEAGFFDEAHRIIVSKERVLIEAATVAGVSCAIQSIRQMLSGQRGRLTLPCLVIEDSPSMGWRGLHLDVSRHFRGPADVKRFIDVAAFHKFNVFHWHLTDDQGWRIPVDGYPRLLEVAAWREGTLIGHNEDPGELPVDPTRHGGYYTHEEISDVVAYAAARGVHVLPEVDVPGHVQALVSAYPELGNTGAAPGVRTRWGISFNTLNLEEATFEFLEATVATLVRLFPFRYIHFGGDEAPINEWVASPRVQERKRELGIVTDHDVQGYFTARLAKSVQARDRRLIGWDELIEHTQPPEGTAVMYWRDHHVGEVQPDIKALLAGYPVVLAPCKSTYFDLYQGPTPDGDGEPLALGGNLTLKRVYEWAPLARYSDELRRGVLGAQAQLWSEYIPTRRMLDYMAYPRACAFAQVLWTGEGREDWDSFSRRLDAHLPRLDRVGVAYRPMDAACAPLN